MNLLAYRESAEFYDLFAGEEDVAYYKELGLRFGSALEIGVGTARVAIVLARAGVKVCGIDNSPQMLNEARRKIDRESNDVKSRIRLIEADMKNFSLAETFSLIYIPSSTIQHCVDLEDRISCLKAINTHLSRNGLLAFNLILPHAAYGNELSSIGKKVQDDRTVMRFISYNWNRQDLLLDVSVFFEVYKRGRMMERVLDCSVIAVITKSEMFRLLESTGFKVEKVYGDYAKSGEVSDQIIVEARKT